MNSFIEFLKRHSLVNGILLIFLFTWPFDMAILGWLPFHVPYIVSLIYGWGISIAALVMTGFTLGKDGVIALLKRFLIWRVGWKWYFVAFFLYPVVFSLSVLLNAARTGTPIDFSTVIAHKIFGASASLPVFILPFFIYDFLSNGEEIGWRGYVLPRLQAKHSALVSSLILGVVWAFWHFPRYLTPGNKASFALLIVKILADAVIYTWVYNNTKGSVLLTTILHAAGNTAGAFLPMANTLSGEHMDVYIIAIIFLIIIATAIVSSTGYETFSRREPELIQNI